MNTDAIFQKYWKTLLDLNIASEVDSAIALALRLAIQEAHEATLENAQTEMSELRQELAMARENYRGLRGNLDDALDAYEHLTTQLNDTNEDATSARRELTTLIAERDALRQQLAQLDADNADLTKKLAAFNGAASMPTPAAHVNGNGATPEPFDWKHPISTELADYWESLDAGRRSFRQLDKRIRLDLVQTALASFEQLPTQAAFNAAKPEWMPSATSICTAFACKWEDLPALKWEQVKL